VTKTRGKNRKRSVRTTFSSIRQAIRCIHKNDGLYQWRDESSRKTHVFHVGYDGFVIKSSSNYERQASNLTREKLRHTRNGNSLALTSRADRVSQVQTSFEYVTRHYSRYTE